ncbi:MAG: aromatic amino acid ammonia-lyase, partial [bacterium]|nr:aromatic amino acid ammonia-lyase [bacterium]
PPNLSPHMVNSTYSCKNAENNYNQARTQRTTRSDMTLLLPFRKLTISHFVKISRHNNARFAVSSSAYRGIKKSRAIVEECVNNRMPVYGVTTGVGDFCDVVLSPEQLLDFQRRLIVSHAVGSAPYLEEPVARGTLILLLNAFAKGYSGVTVELVKRLLAFLNNGVLPNIPIQGSLGASGDLIPLAHVAKTLLEHGDTYVFKPKEALAVMNGTAAVTSYAAHAVYRATNVFETALAALGTFLEICHASRDPFDSRIHNLKPHDGQRHVAKTLLRQTKKSALLGQSGRRVQDAYTVRCAPQIDGAMFDVMWHTTHDIEQEMNSVTDNPLIFPNRKPHIVSGGNFHAEVVAFACDSLRATLAAWSKLIERRIERLLNPQLNNLTPFLVRGKRGLNTGLMILQYLVAALAAENCLLAHPASVESIPVSANQEDFVSMAMTSAHATMQVVVNCEKIAAIFLLTIAQAIDVMVEHSHVSMSDFSPHSQALYETIRMVAPPIESDRDMSDDIVALQNHIHNGDLFTKTF